MARAKIVGILLICFAGGAWGCSPNLHLENTQKLQLGVTTTADIDTLFGEPKAKRTSHGADGDRELRMYQHVSGTAVTILRFVDSRTLEVETKNGVLDAYVFVGSQGSDKTTIDPKWQDQFVIGKTTRQDVLARLGQPQGKAWGGTHLPDIKDEMQTVAEAWIYTEFNGGTAVLWADSSVGMLLLKFDSNGLFTGTATVKYTHQNF